MKDYSNYCFSYKDKMKNDGETLFNVHANGFEGVDAIIDGISNRVIIQQSTNPLDEYKEDRKLICLQNVLIHRGSQITIKDEITGQDTNWLTVTDVDFNGITKDCKIRECNNILKWIDSYGNIQQIPCILSNLTLYSDGLDEGNSLTLLDTKKSLVIPNNNLTKNLQEGKRLLFNHNKRYCYEISQIDELTSSGLLNITLTSCIYNSSTDDLENNLCDISNLAVYSLQILSTNPLSINTGNIVNLQVELKNNGVLVTDSSILSQITYSSDNIDVVTVDNNGLITGVAVGSCNITAKYGDIVTSVVVNVVSEVVQPVITYDITSSNNLWIIKKTTTISYTGHKYNNLIEVPNILFDFEIIYGTLSTSAISIIETTDTYIKIKGLVDSGNFILRANERNTSNYVDKTIELKNIYGN